MDIAICDFVLSEKHLDSISEALGEASKPEADITVSLDFCKSNHVFPEQAEPLAVKLLKITEEARKESKTFLSAQERNTIGKNS